jgi:hypothetical protein
MKRKYSIAIFLLMGVLLLTACGNSEEKQAKEVLSSYFSDQGLSFNIDEYENTGMIETASIDNNELILISDGNLENDLYVFEPTENKKTNPVFLVDLPAKSVYMKILTTQQNGTPVYAKVSPLVEQALLDAAFDEILNSVPADNKETVTAILDAAKTEIYDNSGTGNTSDSSSSTTGTGSSNGTSDSGTSSGGSSADGNTNGSADNTTGGSTTGGGSTAGGTSDSGGSSESTPTATVEFYKSLSPGMKIALVKLDTDVPEKYEVTYDGYTLTYNGEFSAYVGDVPQTSDETLDLVNIR